MKFKKMNKNILNSCIILISKSLPPQSSPSNTSLAHSQSVYAVPEIVPKTSNILGLSTPLAEPRPCLAINSFVIEEIERRQMDAGISTRDSHDS